MAWVQAYATDEAVTVIEIGSRNVNGGVRHLFPNATRYVGVDAMGGPGVDIVADASTLCLDEMFDVAVSTEVMEHTPLWPEIVENMARHLVPGGRLILTMAGPGREPHGIGGGGVGDEYYGNVCPNALLTVLAACDLQAIAVDQHGPDVRAFAIKG